MGRTGRLLALVVLTVIVTVLGLQPAAGNDANAVLALINELRAERGLDPLHTATDLDEVATRYAGVLADAGALSHNPRLAHEVPNWQMVGENVGVGPSVEIIHDALVASPPHLANLVNESFTQLGVGLVERDGRLWLVQVFRQPMAVAPAPKPVPPAAPAPAPSVAAEPAPAPAQAAEATPAEPAPAPQPAHHAAAVAAQPTPAPDTAAAQPTSPPPAPVATSVLVSFQPANPTVPALPAPLSVSTSGTRTRHPDRSPIIALAGLAWLAVAVETYTRLRPAPSGRDELIAALNPAA